MINKVQDGRSLDYVNSGMTDVKSGDLVILGSRSAVSAVDISPSKSGTVDLEGVFDVKKATGQTFSLYQTLYQDTSRQATGVPTEVVLGMCLAIAGSSATTCRVRLADALLVVEE